MIDTEFGYWFVLFSSIIGLGVGIAALFFSRKLIQLNIDLVSKSRFLVVMKEGLSRPYG